MLVVREDPELLQSYNVVVCVTKSTRDGSNAFIPIFGDKLQAPAGSNVNDIFKAVI